MEEILQLISYAMNNLSPVHGRQAYCTQQISITKAITATIRIYFAIYLYFYHKPNSNYLIANFPILFFWFTYK